MIDRLAVAEAPPAESIPSRELFERALTVHQRLYQSVEFDDPDIGMNVTYAVGAALLRRRATAEPWLVPPDRAGEALAIIRQAETVDDPLTRAEWFPWFAERIMDMLERRKRVDPSLARLHRRRYGEGAPTAARR